MNDDEIKHKIKQSMEGDYLNIVEAVAKMYTESEVDKMLAEARADEREKSIVKAAEKAKIDAILEEMEDRVNFFYKDAPDPLTKNYERGFFDGIHNARATIKKASENKKEVD